MPKFNDKRQPAPDRTAFVERMLFCEGRMKSRRALAEATGIPQTTLRGYTTRTTEPPRDVLVQIAKATGVSVLWLVTGEGPIEPEVATVSLEIKKPDLNVGINEIIAAVAKRYGVDYEFAQQRLSASEEMDALEKAMRERCRSRPIPVAGTREIWGVLSQQVLAGVVPRSRLEDIEVYRWRTNHLAPDFNAGDWAIVDRNETIETGYYCVRPKGGDDVEVRMIKVSFRQLEIFNSKDGEGRVPGRTFDDVASLKDRFIIIGRIVGAIRFVAKEQFGKD